MYTTTDFDEWLDGHSLDEPEEVYALYRTIGEKCEYEAFTCEAVKGRGLLVTVHFCKLDLLIPSEQARLAILERLGKEFDIEGDIESYHRRKETRAKDDDRPA